MNSQHSTRRNFVRRFGSTSSQFANQPPVLVSLCVCLCVFTALVVHAAEPVEIGRRVQFFMDDHIVDNRWSLKPKTEEVVRAFHAPEKHAANPVIAGQGGYVSAVREPDTGLVRLWYQIARWTGEDGRGADYAIAYAESKDGVTFERPEFNLVEWQGTKANNVVWRGPSGRRASGAQIVQAPERDKRGFRYLLTYHTGGAGKGMNGIRVVGSHDGIHWDAGSDSLITELHSDTINSIVHDGDRGQYVMFCRPKDRYLVGGATGNFLETGESRRIARMSGADLWKPWTGPAETILIPDELDMQRGFNRFYGMSARWHEGIYWGALLCFKLNTDITTELAWSRDGRRFERLPLRPKLLALGPDGAWDDGMVYGSADWVEMGDRWYLYYAGHDGPHETPHRTPGIGLATLRKEGFVSLRGPRGGGVVCTRLLRWPGGGLKVNADASKGEMRVRVSDEKRRPLDGFGYEDMETFTGDSTAIEVEWRGKSLNELQGRAIRLEFHLRDADLFTFRAE